MSFEGIGGGRRGRGGVGGSAGDGGPTGEEWSRGQDPSATEAVGGSGPSGAASAGGSEPSGAASAGRSGLSGAASAGRSGRAAAASAGGSERASAEALRGTLDLLVLKILLMEPMHGWGITQRIRERSNGLLEVNQGSLYPALQRLEGKGLVVSDWRRTENNRRARFYRLTASGHAEIAPEEASWRRHVEGVSLVLAGG